jgi:predicted small metal-binding protein
MRSSFQEAKLLSRSGEEYATPVKEAMAMRAIQEGEATMRAVLCASVCNCRHTLRADGDEGLVEVALEHLRRNHPAAPLGEERVRRIVLSCAYDIEYARV